MLLPWVLTWAPGSCLWPSECVLSVLAGSGELGRLQFVGKQLSDSSAGVHSGGTLQFVTSHLCAPEALCGTPEVLLVPGVLCEGQPSSAEIF